MHFSHEDEMQTTRDQLKIFNYLLCMDNKNICIPGPEDEGETGSVQICVRQA